MSAALDVDNMAQFKQGFLIPGDQEQKEHDETIVLALEENHFKAEQAEGQYLDDALEFQENYLAFSQQNSAQENGMNSN